ncbi:unnamed protein product [Sordaria macrospora k-hell]|uniref:WGS project CABT00000000 data, contig 2.5 n=1 Tax=Sordaria macrospora (strain ATCC MYA-333 / DSM 997 / K(L3346) / K-hell) TaxID=771870 RepID=F7VS78_SORMK|nr:uncharacterized protein SMAC_01912 [Sordaria macrospora k-hell]CCC08364.1 unnamed protein product [Sordaria macrospora k-hell]
MPLSPSTQGTSIISRDSMDKSVGVPVTTVTAPDSPTAIPEATKLSSDRDQLQVNEKLDHFISDDEDNISNGNGHMNGSGSTLGQEYLKPEQDPGNGKTIKKKASLMGLKNKFSSKFSSFTKSKKGKTSCPASPESMLVVPADDNDATLSDSSPDIVKRAKKWRPRSSGS